MTSEVSQRLITQITERDQHGKAKYGTSLDRKDLSIEEWLQHGIEEALDLAGYLEAAKREIAALRDRLESVTDLLNRARPHVYGSAEVGHLLEGFGPRKEAADDRLLAAIDHAITKELGGK